MSIWYGVCQFGLNDAGTSFELRICQFWSLRVASISEMCCVCPGLIIVQSTDICCPLQSGLWLNSLRTVDVLIFFQLGCLHLIFLLL